MGHSLSLHSSEASRASSQALPPCCALTATLRERLRVPFPQVVLQALHALQALSSQWTGHSFSLHPSVASRAPSHALPPCCAATVTLRERVFVPSPQVALQAVQLDQALSSQ